MGKHIEIESFNPYENLFPGRKLVDKETLKLIKVLRQEGHEVLVRPDNETPVEYLFKKGVIEFLTNPLNMLLVNIPVTFVVNLLTNYFQKRIDRGEDKRKIEEGKKNIILIDHSNNITINLEGKGLSRGEIADIEHQRIALKAEFSKAMSLESPYNDLPTPLFIQHEPIIVGWCRPLLTEKGLLLDGARIEDKNVYRKIEQGKIRGASVTGIAEKAVCSICGGQYVACNHIAKDVYEEKSCSVSITKSVAVEVSLVKEPINEECLIHIKKNHA